MKNPCGVTRGKIINRAEVNGVPVYFGTGVNPVNSPAQFFVAWGKGVLAEGLIHTFNSEALDEGQIWYVDEDEAEGKYLAVLQTLGQRNIIG